MEGLLVHIEGFGWWSPGVADWATAAPLLRACKPLPTGGARPAATMLASSERRRAAEPVLIACDVAAQACAMAACDAASLPCVFASMHGDIEISDSLCATLAEDPLQLSPTRFHNSVHNAPAGYWTVAAGCHAASTAVSAWHGSLAAGLFEAAAQAHADATPVLFATYEIAARGALASVISSPHAFGAALVLRHERGPRALASLRLRHGTSTGGSNAHVCADDVDPGAPARALFGALARADACRLQLPYGAATLLTVEVGA